jgi:cytochrome c-type biogenesis protein CcmH
MKGLTRLTVLMLTLFAVVATVPASPARAVEPDEILKDPVLEARARSISKILRCLVCQNQSIDDSNAGLARDLRLVVRERLTAGDNDKAVIGYITARYGDFVLLKPPFKSSTYLLWGGPAAIAAAGLIAVVVTFRRRLAAQSSDIAPLSDEEIQRLAKLAAGDQDRAVG